MTELSIEQLSERVGERVLKGLVVSPDEVWFPYSVEAVKLLREGLIIAARNTSSVHLTTLVDDREDQHFSLMRIDSIETRHFIIDTIRQDRSNTPVSVEGLLEKHQHEWRRRVADPEENNLRIVAHVSETGLELDLPMSAAALRGYDFRVGPNNGTTMLGEIAYLMVQDVVKMIVNREMSDPSPNNRTIVAGSHTLYRNPNLDVLMDTDALFRRHLGIFGFTGAGKSNLLSTLIRRSLETGSDEDAEGEANVLLFDVNNEFFGLLCDALVDFDSHLVFVDDELGSSMSAFLDGDYSQLDAAVDEVLRTVTLSSSIKRAIGNNATRSNLRQLTQLLLASGRFKKLERATEPKGLQLVIDEIQEYAGSLRKRLGGKGAAKKKEAWNVIVEELALVHGDLNRSATGEDFLRILEVLRQAWEYCSTDDESDEDSPVSVALKDHVPKGTKENLYGELVGPIEALVKFVVGVSRRFEAPIKLRGHSIDMSGLFGALHDNKRTLMIFLGSESALRQFAYELGSFIYDVRRRNGIVDPATIFIFDEADVFIPLNVPTGTDDEKDSVKLSKKIATTLSRRGRKYGLGLGIATQRITYLDTSILAQIGTYFVGKLPRMSDRQRITEGFGIDKDSLQTGIKSVGDWVVLSHTAVGDRGAPLPVHFDNADQRISSFLENFELGRYIDLSALASRNDYHQDLAEHSEDFCSRPEDLGFLP